MNCYYSGARQESMPLRTKLLDSAGVKIGDACAVRFEMLLCGP